MTKTQILEALQDKGITVNPQQSKAELYAKLTGNPVSTETPRTVASLTPDEVKDVHTSLSDTEKILAAMQGLAAQVDNVSKRLSRVEDGGKNEFKAEPSQADIDAANAGKEKIDPRIVKIVEDTLGIDFAIEISSYDDKPGSQLDILVPKRLSMVPDRQRPVKDTKTGEYMIDEKTKRIVEETYWPGDKRSIALGSATSYDVIQQHCNRIRAFIVSWYQKMNRPLPEFRIK